MTEWYGVTETITKWFNWKNCVLNKWMGEWLREEKGIS